MSINKIKNKDICIDIDGVLTNETKGHNYSQRTVKNGIQEILEGLKDRNNRIILYTARRQCDKEVTINWLQENKLIFNEIYFDKPLADIYIDDKMMDFKIWKKYY